MVEFKTQPYTAMDRQYHERIEVEPVSSHANIEEPIIPIGELGQTIVEVDRQVSWLVFAIIGDFI